MSLHSSFPWLTGIVCTLAVCTPATAQDPAIDAERCEANRAAGPITFLTSFGYAASPGILDILAAQQQGYFEALCLTVVMQPGSSNIQLVSAGTAQLAGVGGPADVLSGRDNNANVVGIATYGNTGIMELLTMADSGIETIADFAGKTLGYKGAVPPQMRAMFLDQGLGEDAVNWVSVGYDPSILPNGQVQGLTAYKSNEPLELRAQGHDIVAWDPTDYGVYSAFNTQIVNADWAQAHPTAVEDFLRASLHGLDWINAEEANLDSALEFAATLSEAGYDIARSKERWHAEMALVEESRDPAAGHGWQTIEQWETEARLLARFDLISPVEDIGEAFDNSYLEAIHDGPRLIWTAP